MPLRSTVLHFNVYKYILLSYSHSLRSATLYLAMILPAIIRRLADRRVTESWGRIVELLSKVAHRAFPLRRYSQRGYNEVYLFICCLRNQDLN